MIPFRINSSDETKEPQDPQRTEKKDPTQTRTTAPMTDDGRKKRFAQVLEPADDKKPKVTKVSSNKNDDEDEKISPLELAAQAQKNIRKAKPEPTITSTTVFRNEPGDEEIIVEISPADDDTPASMPLPTPAKTSNEAPRGSLNTPLIDKNADSDMPSPSDGKKPTVVPTAKTGLEENKNESATTSSFVDSIAFAPAPPIVYAVAQTESTKAAQQVSNAREILLKLAQEMVEKIQQVKALDRTETTLTLQYPPLFAGVEIKITEFNTSQKEFNLTFSNLTNPAARALIEQSANQFKLQQALIDKGYTLRTITVEREIPGLASTVEPGDVAFRRPQDKKDATDQDDGDVT